MSGPQIPGSTGPRLVDYQAPEAPVGSDPYLQAAFPLPDRARRLAWQICWLLFYRPSPRPLHAWRALLLRLFGATLGPHCHFYPGVTIWAPWNLHCAGHVAAGDGVEIYNPAMMRLESHVILSQGSYLCGATHNYNDPAFPLIAYRMTIEAHAWICARAMVAPGVHVGEGAVLGLGAVALRDLAPWTVYSGNPANDVRKRTRPTGPQATALGMAGPAQAGLDPAGLDPAGLDPADRR